MNGIQVLRRLATAIVFCFLVPIAHAMPFQTYIEAPGPLGPLKGTMLSPSLVHAPVVLIVPGSGPTDRDGNNSLGIKSASYRMLAEGLAEKGVATVRIDKRGMFASADAVADPNNVTVDDYAADVHAWIKSIRKATGAACVWVLGHSEGGLVALTSAQNPEGICGLVLVSTAGRPLGTVLREQLKANSANGPLLADADRTIALLETGKRVDVSELHPVVQNLFAPPVQGFLISEMRLDPAQLIASYSGPVAIIQGDKDLQVSISDARRLKEWGPSAQLITLPGINHVLKGVVGDSRDDNLATYVNPSLPIGPGVVDVIADFVTSARK